MLQESCHKISDGLQYTAQVSQTYSFASSNPPETHTLPPSRLLLLFSLLFWCEIYYLTAIVSIRPLLVVGLIGAFEGLMFYSLTRRTHNVKQQNSGTRTLNTLAKAPFPSGFSTLKSFIDILTGTVRKHAYTAGTRKNDYYDTTLGITEGTFATNFFVEKKIFARFFSIFFTRNREKYQF